MLQVTSLALSPVLLWLFTAAGTCVAELCDCLSRLLLLLLLVLLVCGHLA